MTGRSIPTRFACLSLTSNFRDLFEFQARFRKSDDQPAKKAKNQTAAECMKGFLWLVNQKPHATCTGVIQAHVAYSNLFV